MINFINKSSHNLCSKLPCQLLAYPALQAPTVTIYISAIPTVIAGDWHSLHCTTTVEENLIAIPILEWRLPKNAGEVVVGPQLTVGNTSTILLTFNEMQTSQGGLYQCIATVNITGLDAQSQTANGTIYVKSKCRN